MITKKVTVVGGQNNHGVLALPLLFKTSKQATKVVVDFFY